MNSCAEVQNPAPAPRQEKIGSAATQKNANLMTCVTPDNRPVPFPPPRKKKIGRAPDRRLRVVRSARWLGGALGTRRIVFRVRIEHIASFGCRWTPPKNEKLILQEISVVF